MVQLMSVVPYTVVLKQVKPLYPSIKVYRYEVRQPKIWQDGNTHFIYHKPLQGQRLYPIPVKPGRDENYKSRVAVKKEKKFSKVSSEKPVLKDPPLSGLSQHLVPPVLNQITEYSEVKEEGTQEDDNDIRPLLASPHSEKSFASFGQEKGTLYKNPGDWATPVPQADSSNSENNTEAKFTPSQLYLQIRHKNTVLHVPQSEALKDAETLEELINAPRLKELERTTHVQETYSEEGYEDAGYDHAGHIRQAQHGEVYDAKDEGKFKIKEAPILLDYDSDLGETKKEPFKKENDLLERNSTNKLEPRITRSRSEETKAFVDYAKIPKNYKGEHIYSSRIINQKKNANRNYEELNAEKAPNGQVTFPSYFGEMPPTAESAMPLDSVSVYKPPIKKSSKYRKTDFNSTKIYPISKSTSASVSDFTDFNPYVSATDSQGSPSTKSLKYSKIYSKKTKQLRLEPLQNENNPLSHTKIEIPSQNDSQPEHKNKNSEAEGPINQRIVLPTIGYINSLTTAHFGKGTSQPPQSKFKPQLNGPLNLTQALKYLRTNRNQNNYDVAKNPTEIDIRTFEPMKLKKFRHDPHKTKRDVYLIGEREGDDESDFPHDEKNKEIEENERKRIEEENQDKEKYAAELKKEISKQEKEIVEETFKNIGVEDDVAEVFPEFLSSNMKSHYAFPVETTTTPINVKKYPFYMSKRLPENSPLRYATDPKQFPKKTGYKMEFYESREKLIQCPDFHPDLSDIPNSNSTESEDETEDTQRIIDLGSKIACLRMKYFDPEPFDNPIFKEKEIDYVGKNLKRHKKTQSKIAPYQKDQKFQQSNHRKFIDPKLKNIANIGFDFNRNHSFKLNKMLIRPEIKSPFKKPVKMFSAARPTIFSNTEKKEIMQNAKVLNELSSFWPQTFLNKSNSELKTVYSSKPQIHHLPNISGNKNQLVKPHNCLPNISQIAPLNGSKNLTVDCEDATLIQEILNNVTFLRKIPKKEIRREKNSKNENIFSLQNYQSDWIPVTGYTLLKHFNGFSKPMNRRTDKVTKLIKETSLNDTSSHYVIDELKEDENVRKGEVMEEMDHYLKLMEDELKETTTLKIDLKTENSTRKRRGTQNGAIKTKPPSDFAKRLEFSFDKSTTKSEHNEAQPRQYQFKRPLKRLSGLDFLVRYHKNKNKLTSQKAEDFWKITTHQPIKSEKILKNEKSAPKITKNTEDKISNNYKDTSKKGAFEQRKQPLVTLSTEQSIKTKNQQNNENRISAPNGEKNTKKPDSKISKIRKTQNVSTENVSSIRSQNFTKIITKISRETSESSEKPRIIYKQMASKSLQNSSSETPKFSPLRPEERQYKTVNRSSGFFQNSNSELLSRSTENPVEPVLYYIVNLKTGRGKWVTGYDEQKSKELGKYQKSQKIRKKKEP